MESTNRYVRLKKRDGEAEMNDKDKKARDPKVPYCEILEDGKLGEWVRVKFNLAFLRQWMLTKITEIMRN